MPEPLLGIIIPTFNRAHLLDDTLERLHELERFGIPYEILVSDNASEDHTAEVIRKHQAAIPTLRCFVQSQPVKTYQAYLNCARNTTSRFVMILCDDDSLILQTLVAYVQRMEREPDLSMIVTDWVAYDDAQGRELHRYFQFSQPAMFAPENSVELVSFFLNHRVFPDQSIYRRESLLRVESHLGRGSCSYPFLYWLYRMSRMGKIAFELEPYYREHRVVKPELRTARGQPLNLTTRLEIIGDEFRNMLETMFLWAVQDRGHTSMPTDQIAMAKHMIDNYLHARLPLEIDRAIADKNWFLACDLRRRWILWHGAGSPEQQGRDVNCLTLPAAMQSIEKTYRELSGVSGLLFYGFLTDQLHSFFRTNYPDIPLVDFSALETASATGRPLVILKNRDANPGLRTDPNYCLYLSDLLDSYRVTPLRLDLSLL